MSLLQRWLYKEILLVVLWVALTFCALFFFFDFIEEFGQLQQSQHIPQAQQVQQASQSQVFLLVTLYALLQIPLHLYELLPIAVLIGSVFVLAKLAKNSEFTVLRTSGFSPSHAFRFLSILGFGLLVFTFILGDYIAPWADSQAQALKSNQVGQQNTGKTGAWLKTKQHIGTPQQVSFVVNVGSWDLTSHANSNLQKILIMAFDANGRLQYTTTAQTATVGEGQWLLHGVTEQIHPNTKTNITTTSVAEKIWKTDLSANMVSIALHKPERMQTWDLFQYVQHLKNNRQIAQTQEIQLWKKLFYPIGCWVMLMLALPFAYIHFRNKGTTGYVFAGVMVGIGFFVLNNVLDYFGNLHLWNPLLTAAAPSMLYAFASLSVFALLTWRH